MGRICVSDTSLWRALGGATLTELTLDHVFRCSCQDLFDGDMASLGYDASVPAGEDDYPFIKIYGSCKTCDAYILDYFAEEAFESVQEYKLKAAMYLTFAVGGMLFSLVSFIKYRVSPQAENEVELLGDGGVMA